jgi:CMP-N,N'-diacetyllegionaminic acid synthase
LIGGKRVLAIVPARAGSKGIPDKNRVKLGGRPLIAWTIEAARASRTIDRVVVSTDDARLALLSSSCGADVPFLRPKELAGDDTPTMPVVMHAIEQLAWTDIIVLLQPTSPLRVADDIDACVEMFAKSERAVVSVTVADPPPQHMVVRREDAIEPLLATLPAGGRRQDLPPVWALNGAVYVADTQMLRTHGTFVTASTQLYEMPRERSIDIDDAFDLTIAEALLSLRTPALRAA